MFSDVVSDIGASLKAMTLGDFIDILLVTFILYSFFRLIKDTKAYQMAIGLGVVVILFIITNWGKLYVTHQIISSFINIFIIAVIILFQGEIRRFLTALGSQSFTKHFSTKSAISSAGSSPNSATSSSSYDYGRVHHDTNRQQQVMHLHRKN